MESLESRKKVTRINVVSTTNMENTCILGKNKESVDTDLTVPYNNKQKIKNNIINSTVKNKDAQEKVSEEEL